MTLEDWNTLLQFSSAILGGLTFAVGAATIATGYFVSKRLDARIAEASSNAANANQRSLGLQIDLGKQREQTANAERDAAEAKTIAGQAGEGTLKALADIAAANERTEKLAVEAAAQQERAAKAERELIEVQERLRPRTLTGEVRAKFVDALRASPVKGEVFVNCALGDAEACFFAREIRSCLAEAGWQVPDIGSIAELSGYGLVLRVQNVNAPPKHAPHLQRIMESVGWRPNGQSVPKMTADRVLLWVGSKE